MAVVISLKGRVAHFKTVNTNHITCMTYPAPTRTSLLGMIGASLGLDYHTVLEKYNDILDIGFRWNSKNKGVIVTQNRFKLSNPSSKPKAKDTALDNIEYLFEKDGNYLLGELFIRCENKDIEQEIYEAFLNPVYPLCFGSAEALVSIMDVKWGQEEKSEVEDGNYSNFYIAPRKSRGYRQGFDFCEYKMSDGGEVVSGGDVYKVENKLFYAM